MPLWSRRLDSLPRQIGRCCSGPIVPVARPDPSRTHWPTSQVAGPGLIVCGPTTPSAPFLLADFPSWPILSPGRFFLPADSSSWPRHVHRHLYRHVWGHVLTICRMLLESPRRGGHFEYRRACSRTLDTPSAAADVHFFFAPGACLRASQSAAAARPRLRRPRRA